MMRLIIVLLCLATRLTAAQAQSKSYAGSDSTQLAKADAWARAATPADAKTLDGLARYLGKAGPTQTAKARAVYTWLADNVAYDAALAFAGGGAPTMAVADAATAAKDRRFTAQKPEVVLSDRLAVCHGYSQTAVALLQRMGIDAQVVKGYDKGWNYQMNGQIALSHAWVLLNADKSWHLMDPTWAAGTVGPDKKFVAHFYPEFFFARPEEFVLRHLPTDPTQQLLAYPIPLSIFKGTDGQMRAYMAGKPKTAGLQFADTLTHDIALPETEHQLAIARRTLEADPGSHWARLKISEYHASRAMSAFTRYQTGLEAYNQRKVPTATEAMLQDLAEAESHLRSSRMALQAVPGSDPQFASLARQNLTLIDRNLKSISEQKAFWAKN